MKTHAVHAVSLQSEYAKHATIMLFFLLPLCLVLYPDYGPAHQEEKSLQ